MRSPRRPTRTGIGVPLSLAFSMAFVALPGCKKDDEEEKKSDDEASESDKDKDEAVAEKKKDDEAAEEKKEKEIAEAEPEPIPVEPLHTGLDLMLSFIPADSEDYVIVRDPTVLQAYAEEAIRFLDGPVNRLEADPLGDPREIKDLRKNVDEMKKTAKAIEDAVAASGIKLKEGIAVFETKKHKTGVIFAADDLEALAELDKVLKEAKIDGFKKTHDKCKAIEGAEGWNLCVDDKALLESYAMNEDPKALRTTLEESIEGIDLDEANILAWIKEKKEPMTLAVTTFPGLVHLAVGMAKGSDEAKDLAALQPGDAKTMAMVQPGAGFIWGRTAPDALAGILSKEMRGAPPQATAFVQAMTGEFIVAGSVSPGGLVFQAGLSDTQPFAEALAMVEAFKDGIPTEIPGVPEAKLEIDKKSIGAEGNTTDALHVGVTGLPEGDILKAFTGLHLDAWLFAANGLMTFALGPDAEHIGKLVGTGAEGPSEDTLATLPPQLAEGLKAKRVSFVMHFPLDFLHGVHMQKLVRGALKDVPFAKPDQILSAMAILSPISSSTMWIAQPGEEAAPVVHVAVQGIGNRSTDEGRAALDAAKAVADGADPEMAFGTLARNHPSSAMAFAYNTRAGTQGPGGLVGSGLGALAATAAVAVPVALGLRNEALADELGVKPEDPEPEVAIVTPPKQPKHEPTPKPKADPKPKPKADPKPTPKKDDPLPVEPDRPTPPVPTPDPVDPKPSTDPTPKVRPGTLPPGVRPKK
jgi:hypothetical protein